MDTMITTKVTLDEYKMELKVQLETASEIQEDNTMEYQFEMSPAEELRETLFELKDPDNHEAMLACRNCNLDGEWKMLPCDFCSYGSNLPPN